MFISLENLLLIHKRKFDLRIYFMTFIRDGFVDVWLYKDCYVKFSTKPFRLDNFDRSIHLTNFSVQKYYFNPEDSVPGAKENMWSLSQLINHFESIEKPDVWKDQIYEGIKKNLLAVITASLGAIELNINNFELNGADFMIGFDYEPILIEINSNPALFLSNYQQELITNRLLEDVVNHRNDHQSPTGDFELIYTHRIPQVMEKCPDLAIECKQIEQHSARYKQGSTDRKESSKIDVKMNTRTLTIEKNRDKVNPLYFRDSILRFQ